MAASMTVSELQQAGAMIAAGNLSGFYGFMADQGYNYAILAGDLVSGSSFSGAAAVNYLIASAKSQGVTITPTTLSAIEKDMATQWVSALESAAAASSTGTVDADLTYSQTLAFHTQVFADFNLGPQTWTLSTPGKVLSASDMESSWQSMLGQLSTPVTGPVASEAQLTAAMEWAAIHNPDPQLAQQAQSWVNQNVFNVGADIASFVKGATPQNQIGQPIDGGIQYTDSSGTTLTQYINTFSDIYGVPQYTVTEDIWALPVTSPTVTVTALKDGLLVNASASANTTVSANGVVSTSSANVVIGAGDSGAADQANIAGNNNAVTLQTGAVAASLNGGGNSITANGNASGSTFTLEGTGANADTANLAGATDITVLLGDATTEAAFVSTTATIKSLSGGGTINGATGDNLNILGTNVTLNATGGQYSLTGSDVVNAAEGQISFGANTQAQIYGTADGVNVTSGDSVGIHGGGNSVNAAAGSLTALYGTGGIFDTVYATGAQFGGKAADGEGTGIDVQTNAQASIFGSNDGVNVAAGASVGVHGGGNTVNATAGALAYLTGTNGVFDAVYATGDQYGAKAADGEATGILVDTNSQAYIFGSNNGVNILAGASVGLHGGGETVNSAAGALAYLTGTNGVFDAVYANGDQYGAKAADGEATGILVDTNSQAYIFGSNNGVNILAGASVGLHGGGETVNSAAGALAYLTGTNGVFDAVYANGDQYGAKAADGEATGILVDTNSQAYVFGSNNGVNVAAGASAGIHGGGNTVNVAAGALAYLTDTNGIADTVYANGVLFGGTAADGEKTGIQLDNNTQANFQGNNNDVSLGNASVANVFGTGNVVDLANNSGSIVRFTEAGAANIVNGSGNYVGVFATGETITSSGNTFQFSAAGFNTAVDGDGNHIEAGAGSYTFVNGIGDFVDLIANTNSTADIEQSGITATINSTGGNVIVGGSNEVVYVNGTGNTIKVTGVNVTLYANSDHVFFEGAASNNNSDVLYGKSNNAPGGNGGWSQNSENVARGVTAVPSVPNYLTVQQPYVAPANSEPAPGGSPPPSGATVTLGPIEQEPGDTPIVVTVIPPSGSNDGDPILLNLGGAEVQTQDLQGSTVFFDMQNSGQKVQTAWGTAGEGYLVYDPNDAGNTATVIQDSQLVAGFDALQGLAQRVDGSASASLTANDALWNSLKVWVDTTGTGQFQDGQLYSLNQLGIASLNLDGKQMNQDSNGNEILVDSAFTRADGSTGDMASVNLLYNASNTANASSAQPGANLTDLQVSNLIAGMAAYGAQPPATSTLIPSTQQTAQTILSASVH